MAATKNNRTHPDNPASKKTVHKIRITQLVNRLEQYVLNEDEPNGNGKVKMETAQVTAALGLIKKELPDMSAAAVTHSVDDVLADKLARARGRTSNDTKGEHTD